MGSNGIDGKNASRKKNLSQLTSRRNDTRRFALCIQEKVSAAIFVRNQYEGPGVFDFHGQEEYPIDIEEVTKQAALIGLEVLDIWLKTLEKVNYDNSHSPILPYPAQTQQTRRHYRLQCALDVTLTMNITRKFEQIFQIEGELY